MKHTCIKCDGGGIERRQITHPAANVYGWTPEKRTDWYRRTCEVCLGNGFVERTESGVPSIKRSNAQ